MNKNIIIAILVVIVVAAGAALMFGHSVGKTQTQITFLNNDTIQNGEQVTFVLKDASGNPVAGQNVSLTYNTNEKYTVVTDDSGKGHLFISGENAGKYDLVADYAGNDKYDGCNAKTTITITSDAPDNPATTSSGSSVASTDDNNNNSNNNNNNNNNNNDGGQGLNNSDTPFPGSPGTYNIPEYGLWVKSSDNTVIDSPNGEGIGLDVDTWIAIYGTVLPPSGGNETG